MDLDIIENKIREIIGKMNKLCDDDLALENAKLEVLLEIYNDNNKHEYIFINLNTDSGLYELERNKIYDETIKSHLVLCNRTLSNDMLDSLFNKYPKIYELVYDYYNRPDDIQQLIYKYRDNLLKTNVIYNIFRFGANGLFVSFREQIGYNLIIC